MRLSGSRTEGYGSRCFTITIPSNVKTIVDEAFAHCAELTSVTIPGSVKSIGWRAFFDCGKLTNVTMLNGVKNIDSEAFSCCGKLDNITIPKSVTNLVGDPFNSTPWFDKLYAKNPLVIVNGVLLEGRQCTKVKIPNTVKRISEYAFYDWRSEQTSLTIPDSVISIGNCAFAFCYSLESITIPASVTSLGDDVFLYCNNLKYIKCVKNSAADKYAQKIGIKVKYIKPPRTIKLAKNTIALGKTATIKVGGAGKVTYSSSDKKVATVSSKGVITAKKLGKVKITIKASEDSKYAAAKKTFTIEIVPGTPSGLSLSAISGGIKVNWNKISGITGYEIQYSTRSDFSSTKAVIIREAGITTKKLTSITTGKEYYVRIRSYKTEGGNKYYSDWSSKKSVMAK